MGYVKRQLKNIIRETMIAAGWFSGMDRRMFDLIPPSALEYERNARRGKTIRQMVMATMQGVVRFFALFRREGKTCF